MEENITPEEAEKQIKELRKQHRGRIPAILVSKYNKMKAIAGNPIQDKSIPLFVEAFVKHNGNITEAAMEAFNLDNRYKAAALGNKYYKYLKALGRIYMEERGYGYGKFLDVALEKMEQSKTPEWWDRLMKLGEYEDFITPQKGQQQTINILSQQKKVIEKYVEGEIEESEDLEAETEK